MCVVLFIYITCSFDCGSVANIKQEILDTPLVQYDAYSSADAEHWKLNETYIVLHAQQNKSFFFRWALYYAQSKRSEFLKWIIFLIFFFFAKGRLVHSCIIFCLLCTPAVLYRWIKSGSFNENHRFRYIHMRSSL